MTSHDPVLAAAALRAEQFSQARGWSPSTTRSVLDGLWTVLRGHSAGQHVLMSELRVCPARVSRRRLVEVLTDLDLLRDDTISPIRSWIIRTTSHLPSGFAEPSRRWLQVLLDGDDRGRPRSPSAVYTYCAAARPVLDHWATQHDHLREITTDNVYSTLQSLNGSQRKNAINALKSLFRFAKKHALIFTNPMTGIPARPADSPLIPMTDDQIRAVEQLAASPVQRLIVALAAEHAARTRAIRLLQLTDIDLPNRRITIAGYRQRLGDLSYQALKVWLDHRRVTWGHTSNPYVIINAMTALGIAPVAAPFIRFRLGPNGFTLEQIRADRILHEALTARADPLHLSLVFNISHDTATLYATIAEHLANNELR